MEYTSSVGSIESYFPLVGKIVRSEMRKLAIHHEATEEIRSFAMEGLVGAMHDFDSTRGVSFESYAIRRIRWAFYDGLRTMGWFPHHVLAKMRFYRKADEMLETKSEDPPPCDKTEAVHRLSDTFKELASAYIVTYSEDEQPDACSVSCEAEESVDKKRMRSAVRTYVYSLPEKERMIVQQFFFEDKRLTDIAAEMTITVSWASKLLSAGLRHLRLVFENRPDLK